MAVKRGTSATNALRARVLRASAPIALAGSLTGLLACTPSSVEAGYSYRSPGYTAYVVPADIYAYPNVIYQGRPTYLVEDRWYYEGPRGWVALLWEPPDLARFRRDYPRTRVYAPAYPYAYPPPYAAPPPFYAAPGYPRVTPRAPEPYQAPVERRRRYYPR